MNTNHRPDTVPAADLIDLFKRHSPDPQAFRSEVDQRIAERRRLAEAEAGQAPRSMSLMRRAAAVLPLDPLAGGQAGSAWLKFTYVTLALPALVLGSSIGSFLLSVRAVKHEMKSAAPAMSHATDGSASSARHWKRHIPKALNRDLLLGGWLLTVVNSGLLVALLVSFLTGGRTAMDVLSVVLLIAMGSVVFTVRGLGQAGLLSRDTATRLVLGLLMTVWSGCFLWFSTVLSTPDGQAELGVGAASTLVLIAIVACTFSGWGLRRGALAACIAALVVLIFNPVAVTRSTPAALKTQLARMPLDPESLRNWEAAAACFSALESVGAPTPDLQSTSERLARAIEAGVQAHPVVWTAAARMQLIDEAQWAKIREHDASSPTDLALPEGTFNPTTYYEYRIPMLLATRELSAAERQHVADNLVAAWPESERHGALETAAMLVHCFELLGRGDLVQTHAASIRELLSSHWTAPGSTQFFADPGGFSANPLKFRSSFVSDTWAAVELMSRVGVPQDIDPRWIRGYLENEARGMPMFFDPPLSNRIMARAALLRVERELGYPERSWIANLLAERLLIATLLLLALCMIAIRLAPPEVQASVEGAQP